MKKTLSVLLVLCLICSCFAGCTPAATPDVPKPIETQPVVETPVETQPEAPEETVPDVTEPIVEPEVVLEGIAFEPWQNEWVAYLKANNGDKDNLLVSPLSLKMACLLAAAGADGDTQAQILELFGYASLDEFLAWGEHILGIQDSLVAAEQERSNVDEEEELWYSSSMPTSGIFKIANGIWHNSNEPGEFKDDYKARVARLQAAIEILPGNELKDAINNWADEATNGLIPEVVGDEVSQQNNILANALYLKAAWTKEFSEFLLEDEDFTTSTGEVVKKTMMQQSGHYRYYEGTDGKMAIFPMVDGFYMAVVKGSANNIQEMIAQSEFKLLNVKIPKFDITYKNSAIPQFMMDNGVVDAFDPTKANFSQMMDVDTFITGIQQNAKIVVDEHGVEAAAVTVIQMATSSAPTERPVPIDFFVDEAFTFYIYHESEAENGEFVPELLFYGEYNK